MVAFGGKGRSVPSLQAMTENTEALLSGYRQPSICGAGRDVDTSTFTDKRSTTDVMFRSWASNRPRQAKLEMKEAMVV